MLFIAGVIAGVFSGLGMGGGTILIIILTNLLHVDQHIAQANNLLFFIPTSLMAIYVHSKSKDINKKIVVKMLPTCIIGAVMGANMTNKIKSENLKKYFGIFLLLVGVYEIIITVKNKKRQENVKGEYK